MICPACNGRGETIYYIETDRDENTVTIKQRKGICRTCNGSGEKPMTNADRIRSMSDFELAKEIENAQSGIEIKNPKNIDYFDCILEWLRQPAE